MRLTIMLVLSVLVITGCGRKQKDDPAKAPKVDREAILNEKLEVLSRKMSEAYTAGKTNRVIQLLEQAIDNPELAPRRSSILGQLVNYEASIGRIERAQERLRGELSGDAPDLVQVALQLGQQFLNENQIEEARSWYEELAGMGFPPRVAMMVDARAADLLLSHGEQEELFEHLATMLARYDEDGRATLQHIINFYIRRQDLDAVDSLLGMLSAHVEKHAWLGAMVDERKADVLGRREQWTAAEALFWDMTQHHPDPVLHRVFATLMSRAQSAGQLDLTDRMSDLILREHADKSQTRRRAAMIWVDNSSVRKDWPQVVERLGTLLAQGLSEDFLLIPYSKSIYGLIQSAEPTVQQEMLAIGRLLQEGELGEQGVVRLKVLMFDAAFLMEDYDTVLAALTEGIPDRDETWHRMAIGKVRAHRALKAGNIDEAVKGFREFMAITEETWTDDQVDPSTGIRHSKEMIMGFNATRIGNLLSEAGRTKDASAAYAEAAAYYQTALNAVKPGTPEHQKIMKDLKTLPGTKVDSVE